MHKFLLFSLLITISFVFAEESYARGWNDAIAWVPVEKGLQQAKEENKPAMIVIHAT